MKIIYGYSNCSDQKYNQIFENSSVAVMQSGQKYHGLLIKGLNANGANVQCYSGLPINREVTKKLFINEKPENIDGVNYHYFKTINLPILRQLCIIQGAKKSIKKHKDLEKTAIICDSMSRSCITGIIKGNKKRKFPIIMIVLDLPEYQFDSKTAKEYEKLLDKADGYIFLTEHMNKKVNKAGKPYVVLEGHCDCNLKEINPSDKYEICLGKKVVVYAGKLLKIYGIENLVQGFIQANIPDTELQIFGDGDYVEELKEICATHQNVKYMGVRLNKEIVEVEQKSALLVNPRPTSEEFTKYSFPSKNLEYMASGTPVLTTRLPGMPTEYYPFIYTIDEDTPKGVADALKKVFANDFNARQEMGKKARQFVLNEKSNLVQAKKILDFIQNNFNK